MTNHSLIAVECSCRICKANAAKLGLSLPLRAEATAAFIATCGKHEAVYEANHPQFGAPFRALMAAAVNG